MSSRKKNLFKEVPVRNPKRSMFDLSHEVKTTGKFGQLYPVLLMDCLPGDTIRETMTTMLRAAPMLAPVMHRVDVSVHFFAVPYRLLMLQEDWENFITGGQDGLAEVTLPYLTPLGVANNGSANQMRAGELWDYFGLPIAPAAPPAGGWSTEQISALPFRAYGKIFNDYYRDPNLDDELELDLAVTGDVSAQTWNAGLMDLQRRGWDKDYFTSALPWAQRGAEVLLPLAGSGEVVYSDPTYLVADAAITEGNAQIGPGLSGTIKTLRDGVSSQNIQVQNIDSVELTSSDVSINDFRRSIAIQRWLENNARGGGRYIEQIMSHFSQRVPDYRLQRAEYLGGGKAPIVISEVLSTADTVDVPVGDMAGHGLSVGKSNTFTYRVEEHCFVLGILSVMPVPSYDLGIERLWSRRSKFDFAWPELAHLGEQEILSKEVFFSFDEADSAENQGIFGYIPRYSEYKFKQDRVLGDFRSSLAFWHLGRIFTARPVLDSNFLALSEDGGADEESYRRIFAVQDGTDYLWMQLFHRLTVKRPLPYFGVPSIV